MYHSCPELYFQADSPKGADNIKNNVSKDLFFAEALIFGLQILNLVVSKSIAVETALTNGRGDDKSLIKYI